MARVPIIFETLDFCKNADKVLTASNPIGIKRDNEMGTFDCNKFQNIETIRAKCAP